MERKIDWCVEPGITDYPLAVRKMEQQVENILAGCGHETAWLVEHSPLYTAGTGSRPEDLLDPDRFPVYRTGRGGRYTYHGPGQRVVYLMLDLNLRGRDLRKLVRDLEEWIISALAEFGVVGECRADRIGIWVNRSLPAGHREDKIAAIGLRVRRWVCFHGISLNINPDLSHYAGIVPCGISGHGVTSLADLGVDASMDDVDSALKRAFIRVFGSIGDAAFPEP